jgi:ADP-ribose pyrophosphatase YjhB (NUDIX family)
MHKVHIGNEVITLSDDNELALFSSQYNQIVAAGGIVEDAMGRCLMIFRRGVWDLPKGKQEPGEDTKTCAIREVQEETLVSDLTANNLICITHHCYIFQEKECIKHTYWYKMSCKGSPTLTPQAEEQIEKAEWIERNDLPSKLANTYPSIREVFLKAYNV